MTSSRTDVSQDPRVNLEGCNRVLPLGIHREEDMTSLTFVLGEVGENTCDEGQSVTARGRLGD